jgi:hypothetical protein
MDRKSIERFQKTLRARHRPTHYETLDADRIDCVDFLRAVERGLAGVPKYTIVESDRSKDHFDVCLGFAEVADQVTAISAVLAFHEAESDADYFLQHWTGYFETASCEESACVLVSGLHEEIDKRIKQG